ncbi:Lrp/AsnC family transcriptional regulator [bacterium]|nr:Lrp/AsnC family transcriptional regulator [bacterium]MBU1598522.1 Lrp/AsnC family transcriptional regulator [bacterium]MBU2462219.1 Lrp/AsnC family transcriptional regulator [bacterium]
MEKEEKEILKILESNAKLTSEKIGAMLGIPEEKIKEKIEALEKNGIIIKYKALIDWERAEEEKVFAFIDVKVTPERGKGFDAIAARLYEYPEVHSLYLMSGAYDLSVVVEGRSMKEIAFFVAERLATLEGVRSTVTHFLLKKYKVDGVVLRKEEDKRLEIVL